MYIFICDLFNDTCRYISGDINLHNYGPENVKSYIFIMNVLIFNLISYLKAGIAQSV
jgi:hypothetical protein